MTQMFSDLALALAFINGWMHFDWRKKGRPVYQFLPFVAATALFGTIGPLLYLRLRDDIGTKKG